MTRSTRPTNRPLTEDPSKIDPKPSLITDITMFYNAVPEEGYLLNTRGEIVMSCQHLRRLLEACLIEAQTLDLLLTSIRYLPAALEQTEGDPRRHEHETES